MIDLRSDTVTRPSQAMRDAMANAPVGDDVWGDDKTVNRLEALAADMLQTQAALFAPSGTQTNLLALLTHCQRGEEYIVGQDAHTYKYEAGGAAVLGSIQPQPLPVQADGSLDLDQVAAAIKPDDSHFAISRLLCLENTNHGRVLSLEYMEQARDLAKQKGLSIHLDGARIFNAAVKLGVSVDRISSLFDSVSVCLSKGLGAPVGSVLCADADFIARARRWRKMLGGGMRQAGIIAAGGIYALENNVQRLQEDHDNAALLGQELKKLSQLNVKSDWLQTNMVFFTPADGSGPDLVNYLKEQDILVDAEKNIRVVTHLDVSRDDVLFAAEKIRQFYAG